MNIKKLFATLAGVSLFAQTVVPFGALAATYSAELQDAYDWAYGKGVTTMSSIDNANMYGAITRAEMAKMLSVYATEVLGYEADASKACNFTDIDSVKGDLHDYIIKSCQLGLMGQGITAFRPYDTISRAEFGTALSRTLWGDKYEGGTPYYANHLNALKAAGIMNQISNAESMKEVRGYVMLMLMRSEGGNASEKADCDDPAIALACSLESDSCPAECKASEEKDEPTVVKSGDLAVTAEAAEGKKALIGGTSDLDTITFKTSEDVTISSITLERYGYSTKDQVKSVQLEDEDGVIIADAKTINNKGQVKLTLKRDYKTVDGVFRATVVLNTNDLGTGNGSTIGFKVVDADSSAKNLNLDKYDPYTYDLVNYKGSAVEFSDRNSAEKSYNWEANKLYEVAKFRVKAPTDAAILIKGFTLIDKTKKDVLDARKFAKDVTVTVDGKEVDGLKWNINKDDELVLSFDEIEVEGKQTVSLAVNMSFTEEFDNFNVKSKYIISDITKFNATDKKTGTRVSQPADGDANDNKQIEDITWTEYTFKGGKVKISGTKLGTINAAANSSNVLIAKGEITVTEALKGSAKIVVSEKDFIDEIRLIIDNEEYDGSKVSASNYDAGKAYNTGDLVMTGGNVYEAKAKVTAAAWSTNSGSFTKIGESIYEFNGLEIEKSGKVEVRVDLKDADYASGTMIFDSINSSSFDLQYEESREAVGSQMVGSISISNVKAQAAKASLENSKTKEVELVRGENNRKLIFDGTYTAKRGEVTLKNFVITQVGGSALAPNPTFYVTIDKEEYDADFSGNAKGDIDNIVVADGKSVNVKVEIEITPTSAIDTEATFNIALDGEDEDSNQAGEANEDTAKVKVVNQGTIDVDSSAKNTVLLKSNKTVAEFTVKPSKSGDDEILLKSLVFSGSKNGTHIATADFSGVFKIDIDGDDYYTETVSPDVRVPNEGLKVKVTLKSELTGEIVLELMTVNGNPDAKTSFKKYYTPALLNISQRNTTSSTYYSIDVEKDGSESVRNVKFLAGTGCKDATTALSLTNCEIVAESTAGEALSAKNEDLMMATNDTKAKEITAIYYEVGTSDKYLIKKSVYGDFFKKAGSDDLMVFSNGK